MKADLSKQINLAKDLVGRGRHIAMATVNEDGSPHNTPLVFIHNPAFTKVYWGSHPNSLHSKNIQRNNKIFMALFDVFQHGKGGLYITADNAQELSVAELQTALEIHNSFRVKWGKEPLSLDYYAQGEQRMYSADIQKLEVYSVVRDADNHVIQETRKEIRAGDLLAKGYNEH